MLNFEHVPVIMQGLLALRQFSTDYCVTTCYFELGTVCLTFLGDLGNFFVECNILALLFVRFFLPQRLLTLFK